MGYITFKNQTQAERLCQVLLKEKLIACANIFKPHTALYLWKNKSIKAKEVAAIIKTQKKNEVRLGKRLRELHSYETPCLVFYDLRTPLEDFATWVKESSE